MDSPRRGVLTVARLALFFAVIVSIRTQFTAGEGAGEGSAPADPCEVGFYLLQRGEVQKAIERFNVGIQSRERRATAYSYRARAHLANCDLRKALDDVETALTIAGENLRDGSESAQAFGQRAYAHLTRHEVFRSLHFKETGIGFGSPEDLQLAIADCGEALRLEPDNVRVYIVRAYAFAELREWKKVIADCSKIIALEPDNTSAYLDRARAELNENMWDDAVADCERVLAISPKSAEAYLLRGRIYLNKGEQEKAFTDFERAVSIRAACASETSLLTAFILHCNRERLDESIAALDRICTIAPAEPAFLLMRAYAHFLNGDPERAAVDCDRADEAGVGPLSKHWMNAIREGIALAREQEHAVSGDGGS